MNRKNSIKKITAAAIATVALALPFTSICAEEKSNQNDNASSQALITPGNSPRIPQARPNIPRPDSRILNAPNLPTAGRRAPGAPTKPRPRPRFVGNNITAADLQFQAFSRRVYNALVNNDDNEMDALILRARQRWTQRLL